MLGMDWFMKHHATIEYEQKAVIFAEPGEEKLSTMHVRVPSSPRLSLLLEQGD